MKGAPKSSISYCNMKKLLDPRSRAQKPRLEPSVAQHAACEKGAAADCAQGQAAGCSGRLCLQRIAARDQSHRRQASPSAHRGAAAEGAARRSKSQDVPAPKQSNAARKQPCGAG